MSTSDGFAFRSGESRVFTGALLDGFLPLLKDEVRLQFMRSRPDLLWMHAGAVEREGRVLLLPAASGQGKSTLTTLLCERGWRLLSDDIAPIRLIGYEVVPFFQRPVRRISPGSEIAAEDVRTLSREVGTLRPDRVRREPAPLGVIVFPRFSVDAGASLKPIRPGEAALEMLRNLTNFIDHKAEAVERAAKMALSVPAYSLVYGDSSAAVVALEGMHLAANASEHHSSPVPYAAGTQAT